MLDKHVWSIRLCMGYGLISIVCFYWSYNQRFSYQPLTMSSGANVKTVMTHGHNHNSMYGVGAAYSKTDAERFLRKLVLEHVLTEELHVTAHESACCYLRLGQRAADIMCGEQFMIRGWHRHILFTWKEVMAGSYGFWSCLMLKGCKKCLGIFAPWIKCLTVEDSVASWFRVIWH